MKITFPLYVNGRKFEVLATSLSAAKKALAEIGIQESDIYYDYWHEIFPVQWLRFWIVFTIASTFATIITGIAFAVGVL
jgi:hypothetical protein